ncbi:alanine rich dehydrogenase [Mycobacterium tuberculosis T92]|nr:alanine rich dehydrogenase [Mycobacterium tuberculosis T92]
MRQAGRRRVLAAPAGPVGGALGDGRGVHALRQAVFAYCTGLGPASRAADAGPGHPCLAVAGGRGCPRVVHRRCRPRDFTVAVTGVGRRRTDAGNAGPFGRLADSGGRHPGDSRRADRRSTRAWWSARGRCRDHRTAKKCGRLRHRTHRPAAGLPRQASTSVCQSIAPLSISRWHRQGGLRAQRRDPVVGSAAAAGCDPASRRHP